MDAQWFKTRMKERRVTAEEIARKAGRSRTGLSNIFQGRQQMSPEWIAALAETLEEPPQVVARKAGVPYYDFVASMPDGQQIFGEIKSTWKSGPGMAEEVAPFAGRIIDPALVQIFRDTTDAENRGDVWTVTSRALELDGLLPGDRLLIDVDLADRARAGDVVLARVVDAIRGSTATVLRRYEPPVLVCASSDPDHQGVLVVDDRMVEILAVVTGSWREGRRARQN